VVTAVPVPGDGWVVLGRERWRAQSGIGAPIPAGTTVLVTAVDGTHLTVLPLDSPELYPTTSGQQPDQGV
jgi:membrane-bound ClpP family serine protease